MSEECLQKLDNKFENIYKLTAFSLHFKKSKTFTVHLGKRLYSPHYLHFSLGLSTY